MLLAGVLRSAGCETVGYYHQAAQGQWRLLSQRVAVDELVQSEDTAPELQARLKLSQDILDYANGQIGLDAEDRYRHFVDLQREYVVWNVVAAPTYSLIPHEWCYPIVGCAPYRGYFAQQDAQAKASEMAQENMDTYVGGVPAYSTLGWFDDPILSSFVHWPEADFVQLLLHELAHSKVWVRGDVAFNESFAEFVGLTATKQWYGHQGRQAEWQDYLERRQHWMRFKALLLDAKAYLSQIYLDYADAAPAQQAQARTSAYQAIRSCYRANLEHLGQGRFDQTMASLNNAYLASLGTYSDWIPGFAQRSHRG